MPKEIVIPRALKGVSENWGFSSQEPGTLRDARNMRAIDPTTGRTRHAQRPGLSKFCTERIAGNLLGDSNDFTRDQDADPVGEWVTSTDLTVTGTAGEWQELQPGSTGAVIYQYWDTEGGTNEPPWLLEGRSYMASVKIKTTVSDTYNGQKTQFRIKGSGDTLHTTVVVTWDAYGVPGSAAMTSAPGTGLQAYGVDAISDGYLLWAGFTWVNGEENPQIVLRPDIHDDPGSGRILAKEPLLEVIEDDGDSLTIPGDYSETSATYADQDTAPKNDGKGTKIQDLGQAIYDSRAVTYTEKADDDIEVVWEETDGVDCVAVKTDRQGNPVCLLRPATVRKRNSAGQEQWSFTLPAEDKDHVCRAFCLDEADAAYAGVSEGGDHETARIWKVFRDVDDVVKVDWEIEIGRFVASVEAKDGKLYVVSNNPSTYKAFLSVYSSIDSVQPVLDWEREMAYPARDLAVNDAGETVAVAPPFADRGKNPEAPGSTAVVEDWTPKDLGENWKERVWAWYKADEIDESDLIGEYENDAEVTRWRDVSGNERHLWAGLEKPPNLRTKGLSGRPVVWFNGENQYMVSDESTGRMTPETRAQCETTLPAYYDAADADRNSMFAVILVLVPEMSDSDYGFPISQNNTLANEWELGVNMNDTGVHAEGYMSLKDRDLDPGDPQGGVNFSIHFDFRTTTSSGTVDPIAAVVSAINDGGVNTGEKTANDTRSIIRHNGFGYDRWESLPFQSVGETTYVGRNWNAGALKRYHGGIAEIIVIARIDPDNEDDLTPDNLLMTHPKTPDFDAQGDAWDSGYYDGENHYSGAATELEQIEGYMAWRWGIHHFMDGAFGIDAKDDQGFATHPAPPQADTDTASIADLLYGPNHATLGVLAKFGSAGELIWVQEYGGVGYCIEKGYDYLESGNGIFYCLGPRGNSPGVQVTKWLDAGDSVTYGGGHVWDETWDWGYQYLRLAVDKFDNVYVPFFWDGEGSDPGDMLRVLDTAMSTVAEYGGPGGLGAFAVALPQEIPDYETTDAEMWPRSEHVYIAGPVLDYVSNPDQETLRKIALITAEPETGAPRVLVNVGVAAGHIRKFASDGVTQITDGDYALDENARYINSVTAYQKVFFTDGVGAYRVYDPKEDTVSEWVSETDGELKPRMQLIALWRGRVVLARGEEPHYWQMTAIGDPFDADVYPSTVTPASAVDGVTSQAGTCPDIINAVVPYNDDLLIMGGDHQLWRLTGDPMEGGRFDLLSDITGMAFGRPWCKDPRGVVYFVGSRGGLYAMTPTGVERLSEDRLERRLQDIDFETYYMECAWDYRQEGLHIILCPFGVGGTRIEHYFYDTKHGGFWPDKYGSSLKQPTSLFVLDADSSDDRRLVFGCEDGYVRVVDEDARDDDGKPIDAYLTYSLMGGMEEVEGRFSHLKVELAPDQAGCRYELFGSNEADNIGVARATGTLKPGQNGYVMDRVRGAYCFVRLRNAATNQRFAVERMSIQVSPAGRRRVR